MKRLIKGALERRGYVLLRQQQLKQQAEQQQRLARGVHALVHEIVLPDLPDTPGQAELLGGLLGTYPVAAMFLLDALHKSLSVPGAVCEFGVAQGATSALIANELKHHASERTLWLYDSFEGLPKPSARDVLLNDVLHLGSLESYEGRFAVPRQKVEERLRAVAWPKQRTHIVAGFFSPASQLPDEVCFAYVDFDFYQPTIDALRALHSRSQRGTTVLVDDYGFLSSGVKAAVDEFAAEQGGDWTLHTPPSYLEFASLRRIEG